MTFINRHWLCVIPLIFLLSCNTDHQIRKNTTSNSSFDFKQKPINWINCWKNSPSKRDLIRKITREYELQHQDIVVNIKYQSEFCKDDDDPRLAVQDTVIKMIKTGKYNWDIMPLSIKYYTGIANLLGDNEWATKYLVDFSQFDWFNKNHINKISDFKRNYGGIFPGPFIEGRTFALWYNSDLANKLGLKIKQKEMTFDDLLKICQKIYEYNKTTKEKISVFPNYRLKNQIINLFNHLVLSEIGLIPKNRLPSQPTVKAAINKTLKAFEQLSQYDVINPDVNTNNEFKPILEGKVLFSLKASYWYNQCESIDKNQAHQLIPVELPVFKNSTYYYRGSYQAAWAVFKDSPHCKEAIELIKHITTNDVAEQWLSTTYNPTGLKTKLKASDFGQNDIEKYNSYIEKKYGDKLTNYSFSKLLFGRTIRINPTKVFTGEQSAESFYNNIITVNHL